METKARVKKSHFRVRRRHHLANSCNRDDTALQEGQFQVSGTNTVERLVFYCLYFGKIRLW